MLKIIWILSIFCFLAVAGRIDDSLQSYVTLHPDRDVKVWIFFKDKGPQSGLSNSREINRISQKAMQRRARASSEPIQFTDYPVYSSYLLQLKHSGVEWYRQSRWLNAVSAIVNPQKIVQLASFDFVKEIRLVAFWDAPKGADEKGNFFKTFTTPEDSQFYGRSLKQLEQINITSLHDKGYSGKGVTIALLDDGFNQFDRHTCFDSLDVLGTYDFVNNDTDVTDRDAVPREGWHGTQTLSVVGGHEPGELIGSAYSASFLLAKTEIYAVEIRQEEDNWVAGLEWAEAHGADIVSSSVGYIDWYSWKDLDGQTAVTTLATNIAESKGLIVVCAVGNEGNIDDTNTLTAPSDGVFVISVGGVNTQGNYLSFSSYGPTADGRIKPDIAALATNVYRASDSNTEGFFYGTGTSLAAPLVSGGIALLLEAFPDLTPQDVREALRKTASQAGTPDNFLGYGIADFDAVYQYIKNDSLSSPPSVQKAINAPNPFSIYTRIEYSVKEPSMVSVTVYDVSGREVLNFPEKLVSGNDYEIILGNQLGANGVYFYSIRGKASQSGKKISKHGKLLFFK